MAEHIKNDFFKWFRENRNNLSGEEMRWAETVIEEFKWHDKLEKWLKSQAEAGRTNGDAVLPALSKMDGLDARVIMDTSLAFPNIKERNDETRTMDLKLAAYCQNRPNTNVVYDKETHYLTIMRVITTDNGAEITFRSIKLPAYLYPELSSLAKEFTKEEKKQLRAVKHETYKNLREFYKMWNNDGRRRGYDAYGNQKENVYRMYDKNKEDLK